MAHIVLVLAKGARYGFAQKHNDADGHVVQKELVYKLQRHITGAMNTMVWVCGFKFSISQKLYNKNNDPDEDMYLSKYVVLASRVMVSGRSSEVLKQLVTYSLWNCALTE